MARYEGQMIRQLALGTFVMLDIDVSSQDQVANHSVLNYRLYIERRNNWNDNFRGSANITMNIGGHQLNQSGVYWDIANNGSATQTSLLKQGVITVPHDTNGAKNIGISVHVAPNTSGFSWGDAQNISFNNNMQLPTINVQRASEFTISQSITLGQAVNVNISKYSGATYAVYLHVGDGRYQATHNGGDSYTFPINAYEKISGQSLGGSVALQTWYGGRHTGTTWKNVTVHIPSSPPVLSGTISSSDTSTVRNIIAASNNYIAGRSAIRLSLGLNKTFKYGATFNRYQIDFRRSDGREAWIGHFSTDTNTIDINTSTVGNLMNANSITGRFRILVVDSRGQMSNIIQSPVVTFHKYQSPVVNNASVNRNSTTQSVVNTVFNWQISSIRVNGAERNSATVNVYAKERKNGVSYTKNRSFNGSGLGRQESISLNGSFDVGKTYDIRVEIVDRISTTLLDVGSISTVAVPLDISPTGIAVGKIHEDNGDALQVKGNAHVDGALKVLNGNAIVNNKIPHYWLSDGNRGIGWIGIGDRHDIEHKQAIVIGNLMRNTFMHLKEDVFYKNKRLKYADEPFTPTVFMENGDMNATRSNGIYYIKNAQNAPNGWQYIMFLHIEAHQGGWDSMQIGYTVANGKFVARHRSAGVWGAWKIW